MAPSRPNTGNFDKRLTKLEQQSGIEKTYLITGDDSGNVHIQRTPTRIHDEHYIMSEDEYQLWQAQQPDSVTIVAIVYDDRTRFISHGYS